MIVERLHNARLERERVIEEQQSEQQTMPHEAQQRRKPRSHSVTLPTAISKDKKPSLVTNSVAQSKTTKKPVSCAKDRSASLSISGNSQPSTSTRLPSVVTSLPEKVTLSYLCTVMA